MVGLRLVDTMEQNFVAAVVGNRGNVILLFTMAVVQKNGTISLPSGTRREVMFNYSY
jgi:hypothetical protein